MNYAVIMAGGSGERLWPLSRRYRPKQIIDVFQGPSLLQQSVARIQDIFSPEHIMIVTNAEYADTVRAHLPELPAENILGEPVGRDTANAIGLAAAVLHRKHPDAMMAVFSADQIIQPVEPLHGAIHAALEFLNRNPHALFTFGIKATFAHTGFGYLKRDAKHVTDNPDIFAVKEFREKPNKSTARKYIRSGHYCWNSGMFLWRVDTILDCLKRFLPKNAECFDRIGTAWNTDQWSATLDEQFPQTQRISIDYAVMEHAEDVYMCQLDCQWNDVGSYQALAETIGSADNYDNITAPNTVCQWLDSHKNIAISDSPDHLIAAMGLEDLIIVHTSDATLICHRNDADSIKDLVQRLRENQHDRFL